MRRLSLIVLVPVLTACAGRYLEPPEIGATPDGSSVAKVLISSSPTEAWIFVDGEYRGITPLSQEISFWAATRHVEVVALPMYSSQARQVKRLQVPPLPHTLFFDMNTPPESAAHE
jgi:hypothetical protein